MVWVLFYLSGACGLIYEVLWTRQLGLIFGNTATALSAVLTAFMTGLALGSVIAGRVADRIRRPLLAYGVLEVLIGAYCLALPFLFKLATPLYVAIYNRASESSAWLGSARFTVSLALLLVPTIFMGATLPILSCHLVADRARFGRTVGGLYAVNTFGAVAGAALSGFLLLPELGQFFTNATAVALNLILGTAAIVLGLRADAVRTPAASASPASSASPPADAAEGPREDLRKTAGSKIGPLAPVAEKPAAVPARAKATRAVAERPKGPVRPFVVVLAVASLAVTGFGAMVTQVAWTRTLTLCTGSSTYAFSLIVTAFILGLAAGGAYMAEHADRLTDPVRTLGMSLLGIALSCALLIPVLGVATYGFFTVIALTHTNFAAMMAAEFAAIGSLLLVPTFLMGVTFPLASAIAGTLKREVGKTVGSVYAVNTAGAILGSLLAGVAMVPHFGLRDTLRIAALLYLVPGAILFAASKSRFRVRHLAWAAIFVFVSALLLAFGPDWEPRTMSRGLYLLRDNDAVEAVRQMRQVSVAADRSTRVLYYKEGAASTVTVTQHPRGSMALWVGGKPEGSSVGDMPTQVLTSAIPALCHPAPHEVMMLGLGTGASAGQMLQFPEVTSVDIVEISTEVVEASDLFRDVNYLPFTDERTRKVVNDGRNHLLLTNRRYDVISSEPSNPWMAGIGSLFSREHFELARDRMRPGGVMCQWIHSYSLSEREFFIVLKTFLDVFPEVSLWEAAVGLDYFLLGSERPLRIDAAELRRRMAAPRVKESLARVLIRSPGGLLARFVTGTEGLKALVEDQEKAGPLPLNTDDNMLLEFSAPKSLYRGRFAVPVIRWRTPVEEVLDLSRLTPPEQTVFLRDVDLQIEAMLRSEETELNYADEGDAARAAVRLVEDQWDSREKLNDRNIDAGDRYMEAGDSAVAARLFGEVRLLPVETDPYYRRRQAAAWVGRGTKLLEENAAASALQDADAASKALQVVLQEENLVGAGAAHAFRQLGKALALRIRARHASGGQAATMEAIEDALRLVRAGFPDNKPSLKPGGGEEWALREFLVEIGKAMWQVEASDEASVVARYGLARYRSKNGDLWGLLGLSLYKLGQIEESLDALTRACYENSKIPEVYQTRGDILVENKEFEEAAEMYARWKARDPGLAAPYAAHAQVCVCCAKDIQPKDAEDRTRRLNYLANARRSAHSLVALCPDDPESFRLLGDVLAACGDALGAQAAHDQSKEMKQRSGRKMDETKKGDEKKNP